VKHLRFALFLCLLPFGTLSAGSPVEWQTEYSSPELQATVSNRFLRIERREYLYDNPVSSVPSDIRITTHTRILSEEELRTLDRVIRTSGFLKLEPSYGGAPEDRAYPTVLTVRKGRKKVSVIYRNRPDAPPAPEAFLRLERLLLELVRKES
jgi:hypothetical protein